MSGFLEREAANVCLPGAGGTISVPSGASSTAGSGDLSAFAESYLWIKSTVKANIRAGAADVGAATAGDMPLEADTDYFFRVPKDSSRHFIRVRGEGGSGTLFYRETSKAL